MTASTAATTDVRGTGRSTGTGPPPSTPTITGGWMVVSITGGGGATTGVVAGGGVCGDTIPSVSSAGRGGATRSLPKASTVIGVAGSLSGPLVR